MRRPSLYIEQILQWADAFFARQGRWPHDTDGVIPGADGTTWNAVDLALRRGGRGLPKGSSLPRLLDEHRGVRNPADLPPYTLPKILTWADAYSQRTGYWPTLHSGSIPEAPGETWGAVHKALVNGGRGIAVSGSLAQVLSIHRGVRNVADLPDLLIEDLLGWADAFFTRHGRWPCMKDGFIEEAPGETWAAISAALDLGNRGLPGGSSLPRLLAEHRAVRNRKALPELKVEQIVTWADCWYARMGQWPRHTDKAIPEAPGETWSSVHEALYRGTRGLSKGSSLYRLLAETGRRPLGRSVPRRSSPSFTLTT